MICLFGVLHHADYICISYIVRVFPFEVWGRFHKASLVFSFLKVKEGGFLTFGKASLKSYFTKPPLFHLTKDFP